MAIWKVLVVVLFGTASLALALATIVVPMTLSTGENRWFWFAGLLVGTICVGALFVLTLRGMDRSYNARER